MTDELEAQRTRLSSIPWCAALLSSPDASISLPTSRRSKTQRPREYTYLNQTFHTPDTISNFVVITDRTQATTPGRRIDELKALLSLGDGFNGHVGVCHGGLITTILDEVMGLLCVANVKHKTIPGPAYMTAHLNTTFLHPVMANTTVLAVARLSTLEGRNVFTMATIEDGQGKVLARGEALFVRLKEKI